MCHLPLLRGHLLAIEMVGSVALEWRSVRRGMLALSKNLTFEILKSYHDYCDIV
jgi:hypothetical protein